MFALIFGSEMIFSLPCHLPRYYRPTVLEVLRRSNADLGEAVTTRAHKHLWRRVKRTSASGRPGHLPPRYPRRPRIVRHSLRFT